MKVYKRGEGSPEIAIIGGIHGDEPCGVDAINRFLETNIQINKPVKFIVANEKALNQETRYIDTDLNRAFETKLEANSHEGKLARQIADEVEDCVVLSIHSTQSFSEPFGLVKRINQQVKTICTRLSITSLVETGNIVEGRLFATTPSTIIEIEAGKQGSDKAAENAYRILREFLTATNAIPGETISRTLPIYRLEYELPKPSGKNYTTSVTNFEKVSPGDIYASADGTEYVADDEFYPILVSPYGYENKFGYAGSHQGEIEPEQNTRLSN